MSHQRPIDWKLNAWHHSAMFCVYTKLYSAMWVNRWAHMRCVMKSSWGSDEYGEEEQKTTVKTFAFRDWSIKWPYNGVHCYTHTFGHCRYCYYAKSFNFVVIFRFQLIWAKLWKEIFKLKRCRTATHHITMELIMNSFCTRNSPYVQSHWGLWCLCPLLIFFGARFLMSPRVTKMISDLREQSKFSSKSLSIRWAKQ